jgi:catalase-peroxidase
LNYPTIHTLHHQNWLKQKMLQALQPSQLVSIAWASASTFRHTDKRGGANGGRLRLAPQKDWPCNQTVIGHLHMLEDIQRRFNRQFSPVKVSMADLMVLGGCAGVEAASGNKVQVKFTPGRTDATQAMTDVESFAVLEPGADGFRNYHATGNRAKGEVLLVELSDRLSLTAREMTVLLGGLRAIGVGGGDNSLSHRVGTLSNDFFVNLLDDSIEWQPVGGDHFFRAVDRENGSIVWPHATRVDLIFGSHSVLRGIAETYALSGCEQRFLQDFALSFGKVMELDRFDLVSQNISRL